MKIVLIEDYELVRNALVENIEESGKHVVVGAFESYEIALPQIVDLQPNLILTDITLPGMDGIEGIHHLKQLVPLVPIIVITVHENSKIVFDALCAGAIGYLTKDATNQKVSDSIEQALAGGAPMSANIARMVVESFQKKRFDKFSPRESEVLDLLSKGRSYAAIADQLYLSINTVKTYIKSIYEKMQVNSKEELIKRTLE